MIRLVMSRVEQVTGISVQDLSASFLRSLRAENKSPRTVETYGDAVRAFARFLGDRGIPTTVDAVTREHVEAWIQGLLARWKPATAANRYRALQRFFGYAVEEGEIRAHGEHEASEDPGEPRRTSWTTASCATS